LAASKPLLMGLTQPRTLGFLWAYAAHAPPVLLGLSAPSPYRGPPAPIAPGPISF